MFIFAMSGKIENIRSIVVAITFEHFFGDLLCLVSDPKFSQKVISIQMISTITSKTPIFSKDRQVSVRTNLGPFIPQNKSLIVSRNSIRISPINCYVKYRNRII